jgi:hypothetical protein
MEVSIPIPARVAQENYTSGYISYPVRKRRVKMHMYSNPNLWDVTKNGYGARILRWNTVSHPCVWCTCVEPAFQLFVTALHLLHGGLGGSSVIGYW